jgi:hypothetical protein
MLTYPNESLEDQRRRRWWHRYRRQERERDLRHGTWVVTCRQQCVCWADLFKLFKWWFICWWQETFNNRCWTELCDWAWQNWSEREPFPSDSRDRCRKEGRGGSCYCGRYQGKEVR